MASISHNRKNGRRQIQFRDTDGSRKTIRLGKVSRKAAEIVKTQVEHLIASKALSSPLKPQTSEWLKTIDLVLYSRIAAVGLIEGRKSALLGEYLSDYISKRSRSDAKPLTVKKWNTTKKLLTKFYGESRDIRTITAGDAKDFRLRLMAQRKNDGSPKYRASTLGKHIEIVKLFFAAAADDEVVEKNVFNGVESSKATDESREYFVTRDEIARCIKAAPDWQWQTIIALCRYGGLRCPSEVLLLKWDDILWHEDRFIVHSPKTEYHQGKDKRVVPLFPELRKELDEAFAITGGVPGPVITRYGDKEVNLRPTFGKIIDRAGLSRWPKLFRNLRAELTPNDEVPVLVLNVTEDEAKKLLAMFAPARTIPLFGAHKSPRRG